MVKNPFIVGKLAKLKITSFKNIIAIVSKKIVQKTLYILFWLVLTLILG
jgi:hypothetical protein